MNSFIFTTVRAAICSSSEYRLSGDVTDLAVMGTEGSPLPHEEVQCTLDKMLRLNPQTHKLMCTHTCTQTDTHTGTLLLRSVYLRASSPDCQPAAAAS